MNRQRTNERKAQAATMHQAGYKVAEIAQALDLNPHTVKRYLQPIRKESRRQKKAKALELFRKGYTNKEIAQATGITEKTAAVWLKPAKATEAERQKAQTNLIKRLNELLEAQAPTAEIKDLVYCLTMIKSLENPK